MFNFVTDKEALSVPLPLIDLRNLTTEELDELANDIEKAMEILRNTPHAIAIAANQIGSRFRFFVCKYDLLKYPGTRETRLSRMKDLGEYVCINPTIQHMKLSKEVDSFEGCLSIPNKEVKVRRKKKIRFKCEFLRLEDGGATVYLSHSVLSNYSAKVAQHEVDHLDGRMIS